MSMAAINFLTSSRFGKTVVTKDDDIGKDLESGRPKGRCGRTERVRKERYSLCDDYENMYDCLNYYTQIRMKESSILSALRDQISNIGRASPVFEQTSIGDFLRIVDSLGTSEAEKTPARSSPLFSLFQNETCAGTVPDENGRRSQNSVDGHLRSNEYRRYSLASAHTKPASVMRNKSFCSQGRRLSPLTDGFRERSLSNQMPQIRRIRSEFLPNNTPDDNAIRQSSRKIKRFLVKPVTLPISAPAIFVSSPTSDDAERLRQSSACDNDENQTVK